ncbi:MAG: N-acetylglucosamine-6-phosphate deacetylase [Hoeflea sp.]|uniref:N-acetylglucosamine-6-phosphate deacetylase n=1 Tax=Hoeflea sp. TaxID=1940281 RepID=UPI003EF8340A
MTSTDIITGCTIFDGETFFDDCALVIKAGHVVEIAPIASIQDTSRVCTLDGGLIAPGFVDLQVNGGGGALFNENPGVDAIRTICDAHGHFGTTSVLTTLITDTPATVQKAINAAVQAQDLQIPGFMGLHLEGPHLAAKRKGAHDPGLIRAMSDQDLDLLLEAKTRLTHLMITVAPEAVSLKQISALADAGAIVSLGHSDAGYDEVGRAVEAGARCVTHLFNAMSPLTHRKPGMVGAALQNGNLHAGLIADGFHVDPVAIRIALSAKLNPGRIFLVTDSMSTIGTNLQSFTLGGRTIHRTGGRLVLADGTLAGADLDMASAVRFMLTIEGVDRKEALNMASLYPAICMGSEETLGHLRPGAQANFVQLDDGFAIKSVWRKGIKHGPFSAA